MRNSTAQPTVAEVFDYAKEYLNRSFSVIPTKLRDKLPSISTWKLFQKYRPTQDNIKNWFENNSNNISIITGEISGITVVDLDSKEAVQFAKDNNFPETPTVKTGKGYHLYYKYKEGTHNFQKRDDLPGIDLRSEGGYVVAPPSIHESGKQYQWVKGKGLDDLPLVELPEIILAKKPEDKTSLRELYKGVPEGQRNMSLTRLVGSWVNDGLTFDECLKMAYQWNEGNNPPETDLREFESTVKSIFEKHYREKENKEERIYKIESLDIKDFLSLELPPRKNMLTPWLPTQGLAMVYGPRGIGKTFFVMGVAVAVASGDSFLKWQAPEPYGVLYIDGEMPASVVQERLSSIIVSNDKEPIVLRVITPDIQKMGTPDLAIEEGQRAMEEHLKDISLVIVDNISTLCRRGRENEGESWLPLQEWALRLRSRHISVLFCHHSGKAGSQRGTSRREDVLDTVIALRKPADYRPDEGLRCETHFEKARNLYGDDLKPFEVKLLTQDNKLIWTIKDLELSLTERVAELLNEGIPQNEIHELLGVSKGTVSKHRKKAVRLGLIK